MFVIPIRQNGPPNCINNHSIFLNVLKPPKASLDRKAFGCNPPTPLLVGVSEIRPLLLLLQMPNCYCFRCSVVSIASLPFPLLPCFHTSRLPWILWIPGSYILSIGEPARPPDSAKAAFSALMHTYHTYHTYIHTILTIPYGWDSDKLTIDRWRRCTFESWLAPLFQCA